MPPTSAATRVKLAFVSRLAKLSQHAKTIRESNSVLIPTLLALGLSGEREAVSVVLPFVNSCVPAVEVAAHLALGKLGAREQAAQIREKLGSTNERRLWHTPLALAYLEDREAVPIIEEIVDQGSTFHEVVSPAVDALRLLDNGTNLSRVKALQEGSCDVDEAVLRYRFAHDQRTAFSVEAETTISLGEDQRAVRYMHTLVNFGSFLGLEQTMQQFLNRAMIPCVYRQTALGVAAKSLGLFGSTSSIPKLISLLREAKTHGYHNVAHGVIIGLALMDAREAVSEIVRWVSHENFTVSAPAIKALGVLGATQYKEQIAAALDSEDPFKIAAAAMALLALGASEYYSKIRALTASEDPIVAGQLLNSLGRIGVEEFREAVEAGLDHPHYFVQANAAVGLAHLHTYQTSRLKVVPSTAKLLKTCLRVDGFGLPTLDLDLRGKDLITEANAFMRRAVILFPHNYSLGDLADAQVNLGRN